MILKQRELKGELIKLRQDPSHRDLRSLTRRTLRYIEKLEQQLENAITDNRQLSNRPN